MRQSSFDNKDITITRELSTSYDTVKIVADNIDSIVPIGNNIPQIVDVANQVVPNIAEILLADENATIASTKASEAVNSALLASKWASNPEDVVVAGGEYSAYHWAQKAMDAAIDWSRILNKPDYVVGVTAGSGITVSGTADEGWTATIEHGDTSTQASVDNNNGTVIQDITLDTYGHITALGSLDLDTRYYTETEVQTVLPKVGFNTTNIVAPSTAQLAWNQDERTLDLGLNGVTLQLGQEQLMYVRNGNATTITNKTLCMAVGTIGNSGRIVVSKYDLNNPNLLVGMATEDILSGADGYVTVFGKVRAVDTSMWVDGQILYAAANGGLTATEPTTGIKQPVAFVVHAHTSGALFVRMTNLDENKYFVQANGVVDCGLITEQVR